MLLTILRLLPFFLLFQSDAGSGDGESSDSDADANAGGKQGGKSDASEGGDGDNQIVFPDQASFMRRVEQASRSQLTAMAKELGFESADDLREAAKAAKEREEAEKSELDRLKEDAERAKSESKSALERANARIVQAEAKAVALSLGIKSERVPYALRMADLSDVDVSDEGEPDEAAIKKALETVLKDIPELKAETTTASNGGAEFNGQETQAGQKDLKTALAERLKVN